MQQQSYTPSSNGLQSFADASPEYELAPVGIASMHEQAQKLAEYGRNGDIYVVHAAEGETVVPMEVLNKNPKIKELLFKQMEEMGLDPQEFVVGNELNSINPDTGLPEFFFSRVFRSVKKAVKKVVKIAKKVAPIVLPIAAAMFGIPFLGAGAGASFFGPGSFGASFLGSGIGSLIGGASVKDSIKAGLISGGIAGLTGGLKSEFLTEGGSFSKGVGESFYNPGAPSFSTQVDRFGKIFTTPDPFGIDRPGFAGAAKNFLMAGPEATPGVTAPSIEGGSGFPGETDVSNLLSTNPVTGKAIVPVTGPTIPQGYYDEVVGGVADNMSTFQNYNPSGRVLSFAETLPPQATPPVIPVNSASLPVGARELTTLEKIQQYTPFAKPTYEVPGQAGQFLVGDPAKQAASNAASLAKAQALFQNPSATVSQALKAGDVVAKEVISAGKQAAAATMPGMVQKYLPTGLLLAGGASLGGVFDSPPEDNPDRDDLEGYVPTETGYDLFQKNPQKYLIQDMNPSRYDPGNPVVPTRYSADGGYMEKPQYMNMGGTPQYPRREMLVEGPGTERSDDIPAMLSDGEFVMNAKSVRGADPSGNGNRQAGAANLYNMMRNFEMRT